MNIKKRQLEELQNLREIRKGAVHDNGHPMTDAALAELDDDIRRLEEKLK